MGCFGRCSEFRYCVFTYKNICIIKFIHIIEKYPGAFKTVLNYLVLKLLYYQGHIFKKEKNQNYLHVAVSCQKSIYLLPMFKNAWQYD